jgi:dipeptidyl aminopeptidase/acylaminoacyl peptidase
MNVVMQSMFAALCGWAVAAPPSSARRENARPMRSSDLSYLVGVGHPQLSPDGHLLAFARTCVDYRTDSAWTDIVIVSVGTGAVQATFAGSDPRWSPNAREIAYLATNRGHTRLVVRSLLDGSSRIVTAIEQSSDFLGSGTDKSFAWSPDGKRIAFVAADPRTPESPVRVFTRYMYKTETGLADGRRTHVWVVDAKAGRPRLLTPGTHNEYAVTWAPDGRRIAFVSDRSANPDLEFHPSLWIADVTTRAITPLVAGVGAVFRPRWAPDGAALLYRGWERAQNSKDSPREDPHQWVISLNDGQRQRVAPGLDRPQWDSEWSAHGDYVYLAVESEGGAAIQRVAMTSGTIQPVVQCACRATDISLDTAGRRIAFRLEDATHPGEIWIADSDGRNARQLTHLHADFLAAVQLSAPEQVSYATWDGRSVEAWLMRPINRPQQPMAVRSVPLVLVVHGGPHAMHGYGFDPELQLLAASGYAVLLINPRGSSGYGQQWSDGTENAWGLGDYQDLMIGLDTALQRIRVLDPSRLAILGQSYGGFMVNWAVTHSTRFRAAVSIAGVSDLVSFRGTSVVGDLIDAEFTLPEPSRDSLLWQLSPVAFASKVRTPTLLIHGETDQTVPISQSEEMFAALTREGVATAFARYPQSAHEFDRSSFVRDRYERELAWLNRFVRGGTP